jgi:hypothetical protein
MEQIVKAVRNRATSGDSLLVNLPNEVCSTCFIVISLDAVVYWLSLLRSKRVNVINARIRCEHFVVSGLRLFSCNSFF